MSRRPGQRARVYRILLGLYPERFRQRHAGEMIRLHVEKERDARERGGGWGVAQHRARAWADVVRNGLGARFDEWRDRRNAGTPMAWARRGDEERGGTMDSWFKDVGYAVRTLWKSPGFTVVAVATIALGIGANTAIFSVVRTVLLEPLPYEEPEELVILWGEMRNRDVTHFPSSPPDYLSMRDGAEALEDLAAIFTFTQPLTGEGDPVQIDVAGVSPNFLSMLGVEPLLGRSFLPEDGIPDPDGAQPGQAGGPPGMVILSNALWQQRFGGADDILGRTVEIGGQPAEIVGVMPPGFELLLPPNASQVSSVDIWTVPRIDYANAPSNNVFLIPVGRLRDGATLQQLQAQLDQVARTLTSDNQTKATAGYAVRAESLHRDLTAHVRPVLLALFGAVVFVLLIACANVSNLLLVRASSRDRELAVRSAMGGSRGRLIRQMLIESGVIAFGGAALGTVLASGGIALLLTLQPDDLPRIEDVGIDGGVLLFTVVAATAAALLFGVLPAVQGSRVDLVDALKERGSAGATAARRLVRNGIVVVEVALSLVLLIGAGLMGRSFIALNDVSPGYETEGVLTFTAAPPNARYPQAVDRRQFREELQRRLEALPGVERAASVFPLPLSGVPFNGRYGLEEALTDPEAFGQAAYRAVSPGYFEAMGTRLLAGRTFSEADSRDSAAVVVVDRVLAERLWPSESAVGRRFLIRAITPEPEWVEVVGVVEHQRSETVAAEGRETVYFTGHFLGGFVQSWVVKSQGDPLAMVETVRRELEIVDPQIPLADAEAMAARVERSMGPTRFALTLIGVFGAVALVLALVGLYGVLSFVVRQRTAEIGVRMAFGAEKENILKLVVGQGLGLAVAGVALGILVALPVTGAMESLLVEVTPTDPVTFAGISALFIAVAGVSCWMPARRAVRVDPVQALRGE